MTLEETSDCQKREIELLQQTIWGLQSQVKKHKESIILWRDKAFESQRQLNIYINFADRCSYFLNQREEIKNGIYETIV